MPPSGGTADKLGNRYEALWAFDQLLRIIDGTACQLTLEPLDPDESRGIEFLVTNPDGTIEYWSVKRQTTKASGWTLNLLTDRDDRGRSILGDLFYHVEKNLDHRAVFASTLGAPDLEELRVHATSKDIFDARLDRTAQLKSSFSRDILPLFGGDAERARTLLRQVRTHAADETQLRDRVDFAIRKLLYAPDGSPLDLAAVRGYLADLLLDNLHRPIGRDLILSTLASHGVRLRDWAVERSVRDRVDAICEEYTTPIVSQLINGALLPLLGSASIIDHRGEPTSQKVLVVGGAGGGKSATLAGVVDQLCHVGVPVLPIRFDLLPDEIRSTAELGRKMLLPESPVLVLAGIAVGGPSLLVIDQLDAVSIASGRRVELWSLFEALRREAARFPRMSIIVGCREFDLEHDHRMRVMKAETSGFSIVKIQPLSPEQRDTALRNAQTEPTAVQPSLMPVLTVPLHLSMFLSLAPLDRVGVHSRDELFDRFWTESERRTEQRLGRKTAWTQIIDKLAKWLSANQQLSAPKYVLDDFATDAAAMASEHIVVLADGRYRFFHESFFDYAFARRFASGGGRLVDLLLSSEQHLFRRGQVRQVLAYLRPQDWPRYLNELEAVLLHPGVRFHIKRLVFQWLSSLPDPRVQEWEALQKVLNVTPDVRSHVRGTVAGHAGWFDVLDAAGFFDKALSSGDATQENEAVWMLAFHPILETRSARMSVLLKKHRRPGDPWNQYLRHICRNGDVYHSRKMFELFLSLIDDGTLDGLRPGFAVNDTWWSVLHSMARKRPDLACEAIGRWFDRTLVVWRNDVRNDGESAGKEVSRTIKLSDRLDCAGDGSYVIRDAAKAMLSYAEHLLPRVAKFVSETAQDCQDRLQVDPLWYFRCFGDDGHQVHHTILSELARSLENLAKTAPADLDRLLDPYHDRPHDTIAYLVLRSWTAAPNIYANRLADYFVADPRRLKIGYAMWGGGGGSAESYVSVEAVRATSGPCSQARFQALEDAIVSLTDDWESKHPQIRGLRQLKLLEAMDGSRLGAAGRSKLAELRTKFPMVKPERPRPMGGLVDVGVPIPADAQTKMSDEHWLRAMEKYAGVEHRHDREMRFSGGEHEIARLLEEQTKTDPIRFAALAERMHDALPGSYFDAIVRGVKEFSPTKDDGTTRAITLDQVSSLVRRVHALPNRPCGKSIAWLIEKWRDRDWPDDVLDAVAWYASNDPDPDKESWAMSVGDGQRYYGGDPYMAGINSTRGSIAGAIARLLFDKPQRFARLEGAVYSLAHDLSTAVRSCAVGALLALLNADDNKAISWFIECIMWDPPMLEVRNVEHFVHYAGFRDYAAIRPVLDAMLTSTVPGVVEAGARQICVLALSVEAAAEDATRVQGGTSTMRKAAAGVYSANVDDATVGATCRRLLKPFLADPDESVRSEAASAFHRIAKLAMSEQAVLLAAFLDAAPDQAALDPVVRALEDSPVQLPDLVCRLVETCVEAYKIDAGDIAKRGSMIAMDLSKIVVRLYAQTEEPAIRSRCLDVMDKMERHHFMGLSDELQRLDR